jgi:hypothetical protein
MNTFFHRWLLLSLPASFLSLSVMIASTGCGGMSSNSSAAAKTLTTVSVSPSITSIAMGGTQQFSATAKYSDGSTGDVTATANWTAASAAVATIGPTGLATAVASGSTTITASLNGINGNAALAVAVTPRTLTSIAVSPSNASLSVGATRQFSATATYSDNSTQDVTATASWTVVTAAVATVNSTGLATGVAAGSTTVGASLSGVSGTSTLNVVAKVVSAISVSPSPASIVAGATQQFTATATYTDGSTANATATASWTVATTTVATISSTGLAAGVAAGSTTVTASLGGVSGTAKLSVVAKTPTAISVSPSTASIVAGATQQFTATATYSDSSTANVTATASWTVATTTAATISSTGLATGVAAGSTTVTASLSGVSGTAKLSVVAKAVTAISVSPSTASIVAGATQQFTATATYNDSSTANVTAAANWTAATTTVATMSPAGLATGVAAGSTTVTASLSGVSGTATLGVAAKVVTAVSVSPSPASVVAGTTQQFTAAATYSDSSTADVTATAHWTTANAAVAMISSTGLLTAVASGSTTVTASLSGINQNSTLSVTIPASTGANVLMWHFDAQRSGLNAGEQSLSPSNVNPTTFGKLFSYLVDGYMYAEPLLVSNLTINGSVHNVVYVATEKDSVYAFDADNYGSGTPLWQVSLLQSGETPLTGGSILPFQGITSTPVIDLASNTLYVVSTQTPASGNSTFRLNALDILTGAQKFGGPMTIHASVPGSGSDAVKGVVSLPDGCVQRAALLLANGTVFIGFGSCHSGWLLAYNAQTLAQTGVFNASPNLNGEGTYGGAGGVWMGGGGPVADDAGNIYITTGNGPWDGKTAFSDSVLKFNSQLQLQDYFTPNDYQYMDCNDADLAAGGLLLIPGTAELLAGGKTGKLYLVNTANLGQEQANDAGATQTLWFESTLSAPYSSNCTDSAGVHTTDINSYEIFGTAAYFNGSVYLGVTPTTTNAPAGMGKFTYSGTLTPVAYTTPSIQQNTRGSTPFISANGAANGILWMIDTGQPIQSPEPSTNATLRAYDPTNLSNELYNSGVNSGDVPGYGIKFSSPIVANGKVYISTGHDLSTTPNPQGELDVYGLK